MKKLFLRLSAFMSVGLFLQPVCYGQQKFISPEIQPYISFIQQHNTTPVDYVMELFEKYDVVILGERDHFDITQYDLVQQILSDPRFIEKVGHVMTENGVYNMSDKINKVLKSTYSSEAEFEREFLEVIKNIDYTPLWDATNFYTYLYGVYKINSHLPSDKKITVTLTDKQFSWNQVRKDITKEEFDRTNPWFLGYKDLIMGNNAINELYKIFDGDEPRKKALIIYNYQHSALILFNNETRGCAAYNIYNTFPGRVANVMLNWAVRDDENGYLGLINDGRWDAAFAACGNKSIGFDFANTPFGNTLFDLKKLPKVPEGSVYSDIYHGFIFYKPIEEWVCSAGVPFLAKDTTFKAELLWRYNLFMGSSFHDRRALEGIFEQFSHVRNSGYMDRIPNVEQKISLYFRPGTEKGK